MRTVESFRFGGMTLLVGERRVQGDGRDVYLPPKAFETLHYLLERPGRIVSKEELMNALWVDVEVCEHALTRSISDVREALGDDPHDPHFIRTVPRVGYKFVPEVETVFGGVSEVGASLAQAEPGLLSPANGSLLPRQELKEPAESCGDLESQNLRTGKVASSSLAGPAIPKPTRVWGNRIWGIPFPVWAGLLALSFLLNVFLLTRLRSSRQVPSPLGRESVLLADFENNSGDRNLDTVFRSLIEQEFLQSARVALTPPERVAEILQLMRLPAGTRLDKPTAREICLRDGAIPALLSGGIQKVGVDYQVVLRVVNPVNGTSVSTLNAILTRQEEFPLVFGNVARELRRQLERLFAESAFKGASPLERVTTPSLSALQTYSKGMLSMQNMQWQQAMVEFAQALEFDPAFAMGYWGRGLARQWISKGWRTDLEQAAKMAGSLPQREKLAILSAQAYYCQGDLPRAIELTEMLASQFPEDFWPHYELAWMYLALGDQRRWNDHHWTCLRIRPNGVVNFFQAAMVALYWEEDVEKADEWFGKINQADPYFPAGFHHLSPLFVEWIKSDLPRSRAEAQQLAQSIARLQPYTQMLIRPFLARFYEFTGNPQVGLALLGREHCRLTDDFRAHLAEAEQLEQAALLRSQGKQEQFEQLLADVGSRQSGVERVNTIGWLAVELARNGKTKQAMQIKEDLQKVELPEEADFFHPPSGAELTKAKQAFSWAIEGESFLHQGQAKQAQYLLEEANELAPRHHHIFATALSPLLFQLTSEAIAQCYEQSGNWERAARSYEAILNHKILILNTPGASTNYVNALLACARALERAGRRQEALPYQEQYLQLRPITPQHH